jgi:hypothetical protein
MKDTYKTNEFWLGREATNPTSLKNEVYFDKTMTNSKDETNDDQPHGNMILLNKSIFSEDLKDQRQNLLVQEETSMQMVNLIP